MACFATGGGAGAWLIRHQSLPNRIDPLLHRTRRDHAVCCFDVRERLGGLHVRLDPTHRFASPVRRQVALAAGATAVALVGAATSRFLNAAVASGSTAPQVFSKVSTSRRTRIRRVAASTFLSSMETMPARRVWQVGVGREIDAINRIGACEADRDRQKRADHLQHRRPCARAGAARSLPSASTGSRRRAHRDERDRRLATSIGGKPCRRGSSASVTKILAGKLGRECGAKGEFVIKRALIRPRTAQPLLRSTATKNPSVSVVRAAS